MSKQKPLKVQKGFPTDEEDAQRRMIMADFKREDGSIITVMNGYFPQGESQDHETKFPAKQKFYEDLQHYLETHHSPDDQIALIGDMNISPRISTSASARRIASAGCGMASAPSCQSSGSGWNGSRGSA